MNTIKIKQDKVKVIADDSYFSHIAGKALLVMKDTGNGYICRFPSFSSARLDNYICLDYSEAEDLRVALNAMHVKKESTDE